MRAGGYEPFLLCCSLRGLQQSFEDLLAEPAIIAAILDHLFEFHFEHNRRIYEIVEEMIVPAAAGAGMSTGPTDH